MKSSIFIYLLLFFFCNISAYSQNNPDSTITDNGNGGFYLSYANPENNQNSSILLGGGLFIYDMQHTRFLEAEFLFPIGDNKLNFQSPFVNVKVGLPVITVGNFQKRKKSVEFLGGFGISSFFYKDANNKTISQIGFQPFIGLSLNFGHFILRSTTGPIFSPGNVNFNFGSLHIGYQF